MPTPIIVEGSTATNPDTGDRIVYRGGKWYPVGQDPASNPADAKLTEDQGKSGEYLSLMGQAERAYRAARTDGYDPTTLRNGLANYLEGIPLVDGMAPVVRDEVSDNGRRAEMQWSDAQLKAMSGAASPEAEVRRNARTFFPGPGQNLQSAAPAFEDGRVTAMDAVRRRAGPAGRGVEAPTSIGTFARNWGFVGTLAGVPAMGGLANAGGGAQPSATPATGRRPASANAPPASLLREGVNTRLRMGAGPVQVWTLRDGQQVRLR